MPRRNPFRLGSRSRSGSSVSSGRSFRSLGLRSNSKAGENSTSTPTTAEDTSSLGFTDHRPAMAQASPDKLYAQKQLITAITQKKSVNVIADTILQCPELVSVWYQGRLPLHCACLWGSSLETVVLLVETYPDAVRATDKNGWIPLHYACRFPESLELVKYLLQRHPDGVTARDDHGLTPLHHACRNNAPRPVVECLLRKYPEALSARDNRGRIPVAVALRHRVGFDLIQYLVHQDRGTLLSREDNGSTLLHAACAAKVPADTVHLLITQNPDMVESFDNEGRTPLHEACRHADSLETVMMLVEAFPEGVGVMEHASRETPLHVACNSHGNMKMVQYLDHVNNQSLRERQKSQAPVKNSSAASKPVQYLRERLAGAPPADEESKDEDIFRGTDDETIWDNDDVVNLQELEYMQTLKNVQYLADQEKDMDDLEDILAGEDDDLSSIQRESALKAATSAIAESVSNGGIVFPSLCAIGLYILSRGGASA